MKAVITVLGKDTVGILAKISAKCAENRINVTDVNQTILDDMFAMLMLVDMAKATIKLADFAAALKAEGERMGLVVYVISQEVFDTMHHV